MLLRPSLPRLAVALLLLWCSPAEAQQFGQWSWQGSLAGTTRGYRNFLGGEPSSSWDELGLDVGLGVNGFILHPALARFSLSGDLTLADYRGASARNSNRWGLGANLNVLPFGSYPLSLYANRQIYSYGELAEEDPLRLVGIPDSSTGFGGRLRLRAGPLRGTLFGYDRNQLAYRPPVEGSSVQEDAFASWSRSSRRFDHHLRLDQRYQDFGAVVDYSVRDLVANYDQRGRLGDRWRWEWFTNGLHRRLDLRAARSDFDNLRTSQRFLRSAAGGDVLELSYDGGLSRGPDQTFQTHNALLRYQWRPSAPWTVTPFAGYGIQLLDGRRLHAPQTGLAASWTRTKGAWELALNPAVTAVWLVQTGADSLNLAFDLGASAAHGEETTLRKTVEASWSQNRLRSAGDGLSDLPDLGVSLAGTGTEDFLRGRITLARRLGSRSLLAWGEATRLTFSGNLSDARSSVDNVRSTLQLSGGRLSLWGSLGYSRVLGAAPVDIRLWSVSGTWRPARLFSFNASYRADRRDLALAPDVDADRVEGGVKLWVGAFEVNGLGFWTRDRTRVQPDRVNRGFVLSIGRRFWGWLPFVTGGFENGVVR